MSNLSQRVYEGSFERLPDLTSLTPTRSGEAASIGGSAVGVADDALTGWGR